LRFPILHRYCLSYFGQYKLPASHLIVGFLSFGFIGFKKIGYFFFLDLQKGVLNAKVKGITGKLTLPQQDGFQVLNIKDILYCKAEDNYTEILLENKKILESQTLNYFEDALTDFPLARIHKSYLVNVNVNEVVKYRKGKGGSVVVYNGKELLVSASKKRPFCLFTSDGQWCFLIGSQMTSI